MKRRDFLVSSLALGGGLVFSRHGWAADPPAGPFTLPSLPYAYDALEPHIDARTMEIHHTKHHNAYVTNLNAAVAGTDWAKQTPQELVANVSKLPETIRTTVQNNGGGHVNHSLFWTIMSAKGGGQPKGELAKALDEQLGGFDKFATALTDAAMKRFGSGWAWLGIEPTTKKLHVGSTANQDSPLMLGHRPILGLDVWEHAYYLKYQNRRADYVKAFFNVIDWDAVASRYAEAMKG